MEIRTDINYGLVMTFAVDFLFFIMSISVFQQTMYNILVIYCASLIAEIYVYCYEIKPTSLSEKRHFVFLSKK